MPARETIQWRGTRANSRVADRGSDPHQDPTSSVFFDPIPPVGENRKNEHERGLARENDYESACGDKRLFLQRVEGKLLSGGPFPSRHAFLLREAFFHGGNQQYFLSNALGQRPFELVRGGDRRVFFRTESASPDYAYQETQERGR